MLRPRLHVPAAIALVVLAGCDQQPRDRDGWPIAAPPGATAASEVAWLSPADSRTIMVGDQPVMTAGERVSAICALPESGFVVFGEGPPVLLERSPDGWGARTLPTMPQRVRAAATDPSGALVLITGGQTQPIPDQTDTGDEPTPWLMGAEARVATAGEQGLAVGEADVQSDWNPWRIKTGHFAGEDNALVFVYKRTPFDPVARTRPFVYSIVGDGGAVRLQARWRGTSFSHPFVDADFGDFTGSGEGEIAALEVAADGGRLLTAYHFEGFGLEGLAPTIEMPPVDDRLMAADVCGDGRDEIIVRVQEPEPRFVAYGLTAEDEPRLEEVASAPGVAGVQAWLPLARAEGEDGAVVHVGPDATELRVTTLRHRPARGPASP